MSTFSKPAELEYQLRAADVSFLIFERSVLDRDLATELVAVCPELANAEGEVQSKKLPFLRRAVCIGDAAPAGAFELWSDFLKNGPLAPASLVEEGIASQIAPTDRAPGVLLFGLDWRAQGHRPRPPCRGDPVLALASRSSPWIPTFGPGPRTASSGPGTSRWR